MRVITAFVASLLFVYAPAFAQHNIPPGTIIPVELNSSISDNMKPSQLIKARVMQSVALPSARIPSGAKVLGHIVYAAPATDTSGTRVTFAFDRVEWRGGVVPITVDLRAMASFFEVNNAQIPRSGADRGTPESERTTQLIGGDVDYKSDGPVMEGSQVVGKPIFDGVLSEVRAASGSDCRSAIAGHSELQSLWVFSADACGLYGFPALSMTHAGRTPPLGQVTLISTGTRLKINAGAGLLLRVFR